MSRLRERSRVLVMLHGRISVVLFLMASCSRAERPGSGQEPAAEGATEVEVGDAAIAEVLEVHLKSGRVVRVALWGPGPRTLLPDADMIGLDSDDMIAVPYAAAAKLVDRQVQRLDGGILMPAISSSEWPAVLDRAKTHAVDPLEPVRER